MTREERLEYELAHLVRLMLDGCMFPSGQRITRGHLPIDQAMAALGEARYREVLGVFAAPERVQ